MPPSTRALSSPRVNLALLALCYLEVRREAFSGLPHRALSPACQRGPRAGQHRVTRSGTAPRARAHARAPTPSGATCPRAQVVLWTACLLSSTAAPAESLAGHGYLQRETVGNPRPRRPRARQAVRARPAPLLAAALLPGPGRSWSRPVQASASPHGPLPCAPAPHRLAPPLGPRRRPAPGPPPKQARPPAPAPPPPRPGRRATSSALPAAGATRRRCLMSCSCRGTSTPSGGSTGTSSSSCRR